MTTKRKRSDLNILAEAIEIDAAKNTRRTRKVRFPQSNAKNAWKRLARHTAPVRVAIRKTAERKQRLATQTPSIQNMLPVTYVSTLTSLGYKIIQFLVKGTEVNGVDVMNVNSYEYIERKIGPQRAKGSWEMSKAHHKITVESPLGYTLSVGIGPNNFLLYVFATSKNGDGLYFVYNMKKQAPLVSGKKDNLVLLTYATQVFPRQFAPFVNGPLLRYMSQYAS